MPANTSSFSKSQPSGASLIRLGDDLLRSDKSILEATLNEEHYFAPQDSASSLSGGVHRHGAARAFYAARSALSSTGANGTGRLFHATDTGSLHVLHASSHSTLLGGTNPTGIIVKLTSTQAYVASGTTVAWPSANEYHEGNFKSGATTNIIIPASLSGIYDVSLNYADSGNTATKVTAAILMDGAQIVSGSYTTDIGGNPSGREINIHTSFYASAGSVIVAKISSNIPGTMNTPTRMSVFRRV